MNARIASMILLVVVFAQTPHISHAPVPTNSSETRNRWLSPEGIRRTILAGLGGVSRCHEAFLVRSPGVAGSLVITFVVEGDGHVRESLVRESSPELDEVVGTCIAAHVATLRFQPISGGGIVTVHYPIHLQLPAPPTQ